MTLMPPRTVADSTVGARIRPVMSFYRFHAAMGVQASSFLYEQIHARPGRYLPFLEHVARGRQKTVAITGGNSGIGRAAAEEFHGRGATVALFGRNETTLAQAAEELPGVLTTAGDISRGEDVQRWYDDLAHACTHIDALVVNAGIAHFAPLESKPEEDLQSMLDVNVRHCRSCGRAAAWSSRQASMRSSADPGPAATPPARRPRPAWCASSQANSSARVSASTASAQVPSRHPCMTGWA